jgi:hypothetical protein
MTNALVADPEIPVQITAKQGTIYPEQVHSLPIFITFSLTISLKCFSSCVLGNVSGRFQSWFLINILYACFLSHSYMSGPP